MQNKISPHEISAKKFEIGGNGDISIPHRTWYFFPLTRQDDSQGFFFVSESNFQLRCAVFFPSKKK